MLDLLITFWSWLLAGHVGLGLMDYLLVALWGLLGAATTMVSLNPVVNLPSITKDGDLEPGALGTLLVGVLAALLLAHAPVVSFLAGFLAPAVVPALLNEAIPMVLALLLRALKPFVESRLPKGSDGAEEDKS